MISQLEPVSFDLMSHLSDRYGNEDFLATRKLLTKYKPNIMPKQKEPIPVGKLFTESISNRSFEDRVWLMEALIENVKGEALLQEEQGAKASEILKKLENKGK